MKSNPKIAIIDYGAGNVKSIKNILEMLGAEPVLTADPEVILNADKIIFPGQGHFAQCMEKLSETGLDKVIKNAILSGRRSAVFSRYSSIFRIINLTQFLFHNKPFLSIASALSCVKFA